MASCSGELLSGPAFTPDPIWLFLPNTQKSKISRSFLKLRVLGLRFLHLFVGAWTAIVTGCTEMATAPISHRLAILTASEIGAHLSEVK